MKKFTPTSHVSLFTYFATNIFFLFFFAFTASAQQSNLNEDYSAYLPEVRNVNKFMAQMPKPASVLTKDGLEKSRASMKDFINNNTVLKPSIKNIQGPGGTIPLTIFKPDTIRA